jgi:arabinan endo-1,5-alpha-L-arabinosidase
MLKREQINIRDPFVLFYEGRYYLYGTRGAECWGGRAQGLDVYVSRDLENWEGPHLCFSPPEGFWSDRNFWAPEVHIYRGGLYMFVTFYAETRRRGTQILKADSPLGPFLPISEGPVTPPEWECLDGTLYVEQDGSPYMVFCHEWVQCRVGEICAVELTRDLRAPAGEPTLLFRADEPAWVTPFPGSEGYVTDGPFMYRAENGELLMLWSSFREGAYAQAVARSDNGRLDGKWLHDPAPLAAFDSGHGMLFRTAKGRLTLSLHTPNSTPNERPAFFPVREDNGLLRVER